MQTRRHADTDAALAFCQRHRLLLALDSETPQDQLRIASSIVIPALRRWKLEIEKMSKEKPKFSPTKKTGESTNEQQQQQQEEEEEEDEGKKLKLDDSEFGRVESSDDDAPSENSSSSPAAGQGALVSSCVEEKQQEQHQQQETIRGPAYFFTIGFLRLRRLAHSRFRLRDILKRYRDRRADFISNALEKWRELELSARINIPFDQYVLVYLPDSQRRQVLVDYHAACAHQCILFLRATKMSSEEMLELRQRFFVYGMSLRQVTSVTFRIALVSLLIFLERARKRAWVRKLMSTSATLAIGKSGRVASLLLAGCTAPTRWCKSLLSLQSLAWCGAIRRHLFKLDVLENHKSAANFEYKDKSMEKLILTAQRERCALLATPNFLPAASTKMTNNNNNNEQQQELSSSSSFSSASTSFSSITSSALLQLEIQPAWLALVFAPWVNTDVTESWFSLHLQKFAALKKQLAKKNQQEEEEQQKAAPAAARGGTTGGGGGVFASEWHKFLIAPQLFDPFDFVDSQFDEDELEKMKKNKSKSNNNEKKEQSQFVFRKRATFVEEEDGGSGQTEAGGGAASSSPSPQQNHQISQHNVTIGAHGGLFVSSGKQSSTSSSPTAKKKSVTITDDAASTNDKNRSEKLFSSNRFQSAVTKVTNAKRVVTLASSTAAASFSGLNSPRKIHNQKQQHHHHHHQRLVSDDLSPKSKELQILNPNSSFRQKINQLRRGSSAHLPTGKSFRMQSAFTKLATEGRGKKKRRRRNENDAAGGGGDEEEDFYYDFENAREYESDDDYETEILQNTGYVQRFATMWGTHWQTDAFWFGETTNVAQTYFAIGTRSLYRKILRLSMLTGSLRITDPYQWRRLMAVNRMLEEKRLNMNENEELSLLGIMQKKTTKRKQQQQQQQLDSPSFSSSVSRRRRGRSSGLVLVKQNDNDDETKNNNFVIQQKQRTEIQLTDRLAQSGDGGGDGGGAGAAANFHRRKIIEPHVVCELFGEISEIEPSDVLCVENVFAAQQRKDQQQQQQRRQRSSSSSSTLVLPQTARTATIKFDDARSSSAALIAPRVPSASASASARQRRMNNVRSDRILQKSNDNNNNNNNNNNSFVTVDADVIAREKERDRSTSAALVPGQKHLCPLVRGAAANRMRNSSAEASSFASSSASTTAACSQQQRMGVVQNQSENAEFIDTRATPAAETDSFNNTNNNNNIFDDGNGTLFTIQKRQLHRRCKPSDWTSVSSSSLNCDASRSQQQQQQQQQLEPQQPFGFNTGFPAIWRAVNRRHSSTTIGSNTAGRRTNYELQHRHQLGRDFNLRPPGHV